MEPLRITWSFYTPVVNNSDYLIHLDALVAFTVYEDAFEAGAANAAEISKDLSHVFEQHDSAHGSVWKASCLLLEPASEIFMTTLIRRNEAEAFMSAQDQGLLHGRKRSVLPSGKGQERGYYVFHPYQWMKQATAWCIADEVELRAALEQIKYIGKMGRNGFGRINEFTIVRDDAANDKWRQRLLSVDMQGAKDVDYVVTTNQCLQPPYWDKLNRTTVREPVFA